MIKFITRALFFLTLLLLFFLLVSLLVAQGIGAYEAIGLGVLVFLAALALAWR